MAINFTKVDEPEQLDVELLLAERINKRKKKPVKINVSVIQQGSIRFKKVKGTAGGGIVTKLLTQYIDRILDLGGEVAAANCVKGELYRLKNIG